VNTPLSHCRPSLCSHGRPTSAAPAAARPTRRRRAPAWQTRCLAQSALRTKQACALQDGFALPKQAFQRLVQAAANGAAAAAAEAAGWPAARRVVVSKTALEALQAAVEQQLCAVLTPSLLLCYRRTHPAPDVVGLYNRRSAFRPSGLAFPAAAPHRERVLTGADVQLQLLLGGAGCAGGAGGAGGAGAGGAAR
jgi:histone H3/H4